MSAHSDLVALIPASFDGLIEGMSEFLAVFGEERCDVLLAVCKDQTESELDFLFGALLEEMSRTTFYGFQSLSESKIKYSYQMVQTAAHAAPAASAFKVRHTHGTRALLHKAGEIINVTRTDGMVVDIPDMERHNPVVLAGAVSALGTYDAYKCSAELVLFMGKNWRALAPYRETIAGMKDFDLLTAIHLADGGPLALVDGVL